MKIGRRGKSWRVIIRRKGEPTRSQTFPTKAQAEIWGRRIETEIFDRRATGAVLADSKTLGDLVDWYVGELSPIGRTKAADLRRLKTCAIAERVASTLRTPDYVRHAEQRRKGGSTACTASVYPGDCAKRVVEFPAPCWALMRSPCGRTIVRQRAAYPATTR